MATMYQTVVGLLVLAVAAIHTTSAEVFWERRTLNCTHAVSRSGERARLPDCKLYLRHDFNDRSKAVDAGCFEEPDPRNPSGTRHTCVLRCPDASTDSVTLKVPQWRHKCVSHYTYGTDKVTLPDGSTERHMWKVEPCLKEDVELSIWCKFSTDVWPENVTEV